MEEEIKMEKRREQKPKKKTSLQKTLLQLILAIVIILGVRTFVLGTILVKGSSMEPTYQHGDVVLINKLEYRFSKPDTNDIVICDIDSDGRDEFIIKRVIGLPGDEVNLVYQPDAYELEYSLYVNDQLVEDEFGVISQPGSMVYPYTVPQDSYFVMGDNRNASTDSREKSIGAIPKENLVGHVMAKIYPFK